MAKYRKKPVEVEAVQWTGENYTEMVRFVTHDGKRWAAFRLCEMYIKTLEGVMHAELGDWIIKCVNGEFYHYLPDRRG